MRYASLYHNTLAPLAFRTASLVALGVTLSNDLTHEYFQTAGM